MNVPQSLLDRREQLAGEIEHYERLQEILQTSLNELDGAIRIIGNEPASGCAAEAEVCSSAEGARPLKFSVEPPLSDEYQGTILPANTSATGQRAAKRDIKALVMDALSGGGVPRTAKEITKAIEAGPQSVAGALEYWKRQGRAVEVAGKWHLAAAAATVAQPAPPAAPLVPRPEPEPPSAEASTDAAAVSTQDKLVQALKAAGTAGMTDEQLAEAGIPYVATMQYHRLGWTRLDNGRYYLSSPANG